METEGTLVTSLAGRKEWIGLAVLALPTLLVSMGRHGDLPGTSCDVLIMKTVHAELPTLHTLTINLNTSSERMTRFNMYSRPCPWETQINN